MRYTNAPAGTPPVQSTERRDSGRRYLEDLLDGVDGGSEQGLHLLIVVDVVGVADAHEQDVGREAGHRRRHGAGADL